MPSNPENVSDEIDAVSSKTNYQDLMHSNLLPSWFFTAYKKLSYIQKIV